MTPCIRNAKLHRSAAGIAIFLAAFTLPHDMAMGSAPHADSAPAAPTAQTSAGYPSVRLLDTGEDILGRPFAYPAGDARLISEIITLAPGAEGALHRHLVPMFAYLLEGELAVDYGTQGIRSYKAGDALVEAVAVRHRGLNTGTMPVKLLVVYMAASDGKLVEP
ncbi:MAG: cupin domain-containing protein [Sphingorhabdus sp.]